MGWLVQATEGCRGQLLSPLQEAVARLVAALPEAQDFVLAGGAALISRGSVARSTQDLDFFGLEPAAVDRLLPAALSALRTAGFEADVARSAPGFARLTVVGLGGRTELDLAADARLLTPEVGPLGPTLASEELAVDKVLAVFGRAEPRDFVDLAAMEPVYGLDRLFALAKEKDHGFDVTVFVDMVVRFTRLRPVEFGLDEDGYQRLSDQVERWRLRSLEVADRVPDTGLGAPDRGLGL